MEIVMLKFWSLAAALVLTIAPRQAGGRHTYPAQSRAIVGGVQLTLALGRPVYPRNALVRVAATLLNTSHRTVYFPAGCNGTVNPLFSVINRQGRQVDPPHVLVPAPRGPFIGSCLAPLPRPVPPGHTLRWTEFRILRGRMVSVRLGLTGIAHSIFPTWYVTARLRVRLTAADPPSVGLWTIPRVSAYLKPQGDYGGRPRVADWWLCPGDDPANGAAGRSFVAVDRTSVTPPCPHPVQWHAVVG